MPETLPPTEATPTKPALYPLWQFIGTGAYSGYSPIASGTAGSAVGVLLYYIPGMEHTLTLAIATVAALLIGVAASSVLEKFHGEDPSIVVIDEIVGMWISLLFFPKTIWIAVLAFFLFRIFDIVKPPPARQFERIKGGWGIMLDDVVAGIYANLVLRGIILVFPFLAGQ